MIKRFALLVLSSGCVFALGLNCLPNLGTSLSGLFSGLLPG